MKKPATVKALEELGRVRLSPNFFMRDFLHSEIANFYGLPNIPDDPDLAIAAGSKLCQELLEPLAARFGRISIRSAYRAPAVNQLGNEKRHSCASNEANFAGHIWDRRDQAGRMGATACIIVNGVVSYYERTKKWQALAWWIHDHLPYSSMTFYPRLAAFNLTWRESPQRSIYSHIRPNVGCLTQPGMPNHQGDHAEHYSGFLAEFAKQPILSRHRLRMDARAKQGDPADEAVARQGSSAIDLRAAQGEADLADHTSRSAISQRILEAFVHEPMTETERKIIQVLLDRPGLTSEGLSRELGWGGQIWHTHFGKMCRRRQDRLRQTEISISGNATFHSGILAEFSEDSRWFMKREAVEAFAALGLRQRTALRNDFEHTG